MVDVLKISSFNILIKLFFSSNLFESKLVLKFINDQPDPCFLKVLYF